MDWKRRNQIAKFVDGILECNVLNRPPVELFDDIMKQRGIKFKELNEDDEEFCGVYIVLENTKIIFVNSNLYTPRKNFTIAHELGHHFLAHSLHDGAIICNKDVLFGNNKPEPEKEADHFAACFLMPPKLMKQKKAEFEKNYSQQMNLFNSTDKQAKKDELIKYLCDFFKVSKESMSIRLEELKII
ncbi:MAG: ImmA/IrrE family metallo-endopeptidase [Emergencia timonensis]|uniref:ImmA/IrrE family metallo-endopeptidase n=1 Tax=Emergencia timonensis TaxID=1776384 RepID=UPI0008296A22|nr:ImmA/IrrE family metallo-endopeptidase [Emergencia timonensis]WNX86811.1 ImmA/IrrE family metallo-endopeptidase [Emergencia timonensis]